VRHKFASSNCRYWPRVVGTGVVRSWFSQSKDLSSW